MGLGEVNVYQKGGPDRADSQAKYWLKLLFFLISRASSGAHLLALFTLLLKKYSSWLRTVLFS